MSQGLAVTWTVRSQQLIAVAQHTAPSHAVPHLEWSMCFGVCPRMAQEDAQIVGAQHAEGAAAHVLVPYQRTHHVLVPAEAGWQRPWMGCGPPYFCRHLHHSYWAGDTGLIHALASKEQETTNTECCQAWE